MRVAPRVGSASRSESAPPGARSSSARLSKVPARLVRSADFERVLKTRPCALSTHFALHHVAERPGVPQGARSASSTKLSTGVRTEAARSVDDLYRADHFAVPTPDRPVAAWLGCVVPKRHARRAVTRTLLKRQIRSAAVSAALPPGLWVVRLRAGFDRVAFPSAASEALRQAARVELDTLLGKAPKARETGSGAA